MIPSRAPFSGEGGACRSGSQRARGVAAAVILTTVCWAPLQAQVPPSDPDLQGSALSFAQAWVNSDVKSLEKMLRPSGVRLQLQEGQNLQVTPRQAGAAIANFMQRYRGGEAELFRISQLGEDSGSGFVEFRWTCQVSGLQAPVIFSLFIAFDRTDSGWIVTEVRLLS